MNYWFYTRFPLYYLQYYLKICTVFLLHPDCTYLTRTKILSMLATGSLLVEVSHFSSHLCLVVRDLCQQGRYWVLFENRKKLILSEKNQCVLIAKISFPETEKITNPQNKLPQNFRATRYTHLACFVWATSNIGIINHLFIVSVQTVQ